MNEAKDERSFSKWHSEFYFGRSEPLFTIRRPNWPSIASKAVTTWSQLLFDLPANLPRVGRVNHLLNGYKEGRKEGVCMSAHTFV